MIERFARQFVLILTVTMLSLLAELRAADELTPEQQAVLKRAAELATRAGSLYQRGEFAQAVQLLREVLQMQEQVFSKDKYPQGHPQLAVSLSNLGALLQGQGELGKALDSHQRALIMREALYPKDKYPHGHLDLAVSLGNLGYLFWARGDYGKAQTYCVRAVAMFESLYPKDKYPRGHPKLAKSLNNLAMVFHSRGERGNALATYERSLVMYESLIPKDKYPQGHPLLADILNNQGTLFRERGDYDKALSCYKRALDMLEAFYPRGHPSLAACLQNLGTLLATQGDYGKGVSTCERSLAMFEALYPKVKYPHGHSQLAVSLNNLGAIHQAQRDYKKALPYFERALTMLEGFYPKDKYPQGHSDLALVLFSLGTLYWWQDDYARALPYSERVLAMNQTLYPKENYVRGHPKLASDLVDLGNLFAMWGDYAKAQPYYERALSMNESLYPKDEYPRGHPELAISLFDLGLLAQSRGDDGKALGYVGRALTMREELNDAFLATASEAEALNYLAKVPLSRDAYLTLTRSLPARAESSYVHVWRGKGAVGKLLERRQQSLLFAAPAVRKRGEQLAALRRQLAVLLLAPPGRYPDQPERLRKLTEDKESLERQLSRELPAFGERQARDRLTHRDLLAKLPPRTVFVDLLRYLHFKQDAKTPGRKGQRNTQRYVAFVLYAGQSVRRVDLGESAPIDRAIQRWRQEVAEWKPGRPEANEMPAILRKLVWQPLAEQIPADTETVFLAPDGPLNGLPWAALPGRKPGTILLEDHVLAVVPHGRLLLEQMLAKSATEPERGLLLAAGAVQYDQQPAPVEPEKTLLAVNRGGEWGGKKLNWPYLKGTSVELEQVRAMAGKREVQSRQGVEASTPQLLRDLPEARWVHLATHGFFADAKFRSVLQIDEKDFARRLDTSGEVFDRVGAGARNPLVLSGLVLAGANLDRKDRGILTAEAIAGLPLQKMDLAVLSACETGLGEVAGGEGVFGLQRAFHIAGTRTVVATLWKVDDEATAALMGLFYHKLWREKKSSLAALREAQLELYRHPQRIPKLAKLRGPDLEREVSRPVETTETTTKSDRAAVKLWAGFTLSGLGR